MTDNGNEQNLALLRLVQDFPHVPARIVVAVFRSYLDRCESLSVVMQASRDRITDACAA